MKPDFESARKDFVITARTAYFSSSAVAPMPRQTIEAMEQATRKMRVEFDEKYMAEAHIGRRCRKSASRLIGSAPEEIALVHSTTEGICAFAEGLAWRRGDEIIINDLEYPSNFIPWYGVSKKHGAKVRMVKNVGGKIRPEDIAKIAGKRTKVIAISHVEFGNGFLCDLEAISEIARKHGAYLFVDAIQSVGALRVDVARMGIDALSAGGYKWMCGPFGTGFLFVRRDLAEKITPAYIGFDGIARKERKEIWKNLIDGKPFVKNYMRLEGGAGRFNYAYADPIVFLGLTTSMDYILGLGMGNIERRIGRLVDYLEKLVSRTEILTPKSRGGILSFRPKGFTKKRIEDFKKRCAQKDVNVTIRQGAIRAACHFFNNEEDIERLAEVVKEF